MPTRFALVAIAATTIFGATLLVRAQQPTAPARTVVAPHVPLVSVAAPAASQELIDAGARLYAANKCVGLSRIQRRRGSRLKPQPEEGGLYPWTQ